MCSKIRMKKLCYSVASRHGCAFVPEKQLFLFNCKFHDIYIWNRDFDFLCNILVGNKLEIEHPDIL